MLLQNYEYAPVKIKGYRVRSNFSREPAFELVKGDSTGTVPIRNIHQCVENRGVRVHTRQSIGMRCSNPRLVA
jgi:hypothetical protein